MVEPGHIAPNMDQLNAALRPTDELTRINGNQRVMSDENIEDYIRRHGEIGLD